ncbi:hypothetical protein PR048_013195 [Dryococelus australis]|uniref:Uncharacterized protein n=1 Tax=Dryococelus australis TaxID=614101 RepID=A0ABQ9HRH4_9NEOP|nr:hypothetical protein PR048_013195 [Dryococelus australis]
MMVDTNKPNVLNLSGNLSENWTRFIQNFNIYMIVPEKSEKSSEIKAAILLNLVGEKRQSKFSKHLTCRMKIKQNMIKCAMCMNSTAGQGKTCHVNGFYYIQEKSEQEPFQQFVTDLKNCEFVVQADEIVRDVFLWVSWTLHYNRKCYDGCQEFCITTDLALEKAYELGRLVETSTQQMQCLQGQIKKTVVSE